ncbi:TetR/AcrR family transcriptional regulator [Rhodococcus triatomae]|nr:TetR family transcriptional regulator [Rhodococcus triatomae BKS 15-14]
MARWENERRTSEQVREIKRQAVLKEASRAFGRKGYHNTSLDDVARSLNISKGTLYNYVRDKQEILFECHKEALDIGDAAMEYASRAETGAEQLRLAIRFYLERIVENLGACAALLEVDALRPDDRDAAVERRRGFEQSISAMVERGIADGSLKSGLDPMLVVRTVMGAINWIPRWYDPDRHQSPTELSVEMSGMLLDGLTAA